MSAQLQKYRFLENLLPEPMARQLLVVTGARQTGKTTLAKTRYPDLKYINLDAPENREVIRAISTPAWATSVGNAVIDEAQKEPSLFEKVKYAFDEGSLSFCLMLGSSQILLLKKIRESLAGRVSLYEIWPLMMGEIFMDVDPHDIQPPLVDRLFSKKSFDDILGGLPEILFEEVDIKCRDAENHLLKWGGMPALLTLPDQQRWKWLKDYVYTYLERDLGDLARLDDLVPFRTFQRLSALRSAQLLNYSELSRDAGLSVDTARRYLQYLDLSYQTVLLQPYYRNITSSVIKTPKLYWVDVGLLRQLGGFRSEYSGQVYETMVVGELIKWIRTTQKQAKLYFYRTRSGMELDVLLETENGLIGMEIKSRKTHAKADLRAMKEVAQRLGKEWRGGLLVNQGNILQKIGDPHIWVIPSRRLFI
ncbi:MAG: ATP-binding protein [Thermodesulfobacteriota bacterium]|nr:ATP-binding protein [Thermodesulfobacteriota bacterium]